MATGAGVEDIPGFAQPREGYSTTKSTPSGAQWTAQGRIRAISLSIADPLGPSGGDDAEFRQIVPLGRRPITPPGALPRRPPQADFQKSELPVVRKSKNVGSHWGTVRAAPSAQP